MEELRHSRLASIAMDLSIPHDPLDARWSRDPPIFSLLMTTPYGLLPTLMREHIPAAASMILLNFIVSINLIGMEAEL